MRGRCIGVSNLFLLLLLANANLAISCRSVAHDPVRHALADRPRLWDFVRVGGGVDGAVSVCMLVHEMEDDEGEVASYSWLR